MNRSDTIRYLLFTAAVILVMLGCHLRGMNKQQKPRNNSRRPQKGLVSGIFYSHDRPSAIVGGRLVHEGDTIQNVRIVRIYSDKVEFNSANNTWLQRVQEKPSRHWYRPD